MSFKDVFESDDVFSALIIVLLLFAVCIIIMALRGTFKQKEQEKMNLRQPIETHNARVVSKRMPVNNILAYAVFEFENGERREFEVSIENFRIIAENDEGILKNQGTKLISFARVVKDEANVI